MAIEKKEKNITYLHAKNSWVLKKQKFYCKVCKIAFPNKSKFERHKSCHAPSFICEVCDSAFTRSEQLREHYVIHKNDDSFICNLCSAAFITTINLEKHLKNEHNPDNIDSEKSVQCPICFMNFAYKAHFKRHFDSEHKITYWCEYCGTTSCSEVALIKHSQKHVLEPPYYCMMCDVLYTEFHEIEEHECTTTELQGDVIVVKIVTDDLLGFDNDIEEKDQMLAMTILRKFDQRGRKRKILKNTDDDIKKNKSSENQHFCTKCSKSFDSQSSLDQHSITCPITSKKSRNCDVNSNSLIDNISLVDQNLNEKIPKDNNNNNENFCKEKSSMLESNVKPASCSMCNEKFLIKNEFDLHICGNLKVDSLFSQMFSWQT